MASTAYSPASSLFPCSAPVSGNQRRRAKGRVARPSRLQRVAVVRATYGKEPEEGDASSKAILSAFFAGKALADTLNERLGNLVGEVLSEVGKRQAEQQRQLRQFQEEVLERADASLRKAAQEERAVKNEGERDTQAGGEANGAASRNSRTKSPSQYR